MKILKKRTLAFVIIVMSFVVAFEIFQKNSDTSSDLVLDDIILSEASEAVYPHGKKVFAITKDSVKLVDLNGTIWEDQLSYNNIYSIFKDGALGISQIDSSFVNVYTEKGLAYTINSPDKIINFSINKNGYLSVISKNNGYYEVNVYNNTGELTFALKDIAYSEGIPISSSISENNQLLAVGFLKINDINYNSNIAIYDLSGKLDSNEDTSNGLFAAISLDGQFSGILDFLNNSILLVISEKMVVPLHISNNTLNSDLKMSLSNKLKFAKVMNNSNFVLVYGEPISIESEFENNTVVFYNINGKVLGSYTSPKNITKISTGYDSCIIQYGRTLVALDYKGKVLWEYQVIQDLNDFFFFENTNQIIISSNSEVKLIDITKNNTISKTLDKDSSNLYNKTQQNYADINDSLDSENVIQDESSLSS